MPQLFVATGAEQMERSQKSSLDDGVAAQLPHSKRVSTCRYILKNVPNAKIAVLYQNDDFGKDYLIGLARRLGRQSRHDDRCDQDHERNPTVDSQIVALQGSGADTAS